MANRQKESLTISIKGARLKQRGLVTKKEFEKQQKILESLEKTSQQLAVATDVNVILKNIATILGKALGAKFVNFWDFTPDNKAVFITAAYGMQQQYIEHSVKSPIPVGSAWIGRAVDTLRAWATPDITTDPHLTKEIGSWRKPVQKQDYHGLLCIPMIRDKKAVGGMCIYYKDVHEFDYFEMRMATIVANQAATAVENAQTFEALNAEKLKTESMVQSLHDGLIVQDLDGRITAFNPRAQEFLWVYSNDVLSKTPEELSVRQKQLLGAVQKICSLKLVDFESREVILTEPRRRVLQVTVVPLRGANNRRTGYMRVLHDITEEKEAQNLQNRFVSIASHQLRTPLSGLKWAFSMVLDETYGSLTKNQRDILLKSSLATENLISLVNDLLDVSRLEEGRFDFQFTRVDLTKVLDKIVLQLKPNIKRGKLRFATQFSEEPPIIQADETKIQMALQNIIDNAIKYTLPGGAVNVSFTMKKVGVICSIADTGIGISMADQKFIFNKFFRGQNAVRLQTSGSGLGLFIAKEIVQHHNGRVWFESSENKGSTFYVQLPLSQSTDRKRVKK